LSAEARGQVPGWGPDGAAHLFLRLDQPDITEVEANVGFGKGATIATDAKTGQAADLKAVRIPGPYEVRLLKARFHDE